MKEDLVEYFLKSKYSLISWGVFKSTGLNINRYYFHKYCQELIRDGKFGMYRYSGIIAYGLLSINCKIQDSGSGNKCKFWCNECKIKQNNMTKQEFKELPIIDQLEYAISESVKTFDVAKLNEYQKGQLNMATHILEQITKLKKFNQ